MTTERFYIEISCYRPSTGSTFTRIAECVSESHSSDAESVPVYQVEVIDDPNPKATGPCRFFPQGEDDPRRWIGCRLARWHRMFLSCNGPKWFATYKVIDLEYAIRRRVELEV